MTFIHKMICFLAGATFGFFLTVVSYVLFSSADDSVSRLENKHTFLLERIQTLEDRIDDIIDQFEGDSDSDEDNERFSDDASSHSHQSHTTGEENDASSHAPDPDPSHPSDSPSWGGEDMDHDEGGKDQVHSDQDEEHTHTLHETVDVEDQSALVPGEMTETDEKNGVEDDLLSL